jgi:hypothetical protein
MLEDQVVDKMSQKQHVSLHSQMLVAREELYPFSRNAIADVYQKLPKIELPYVLNL